MSSAWLKLGTTTAQVSIIVMKCNAHAVYYAHSRPVTPARNSKSASDHSVLDCSLYARSVRRRFLFKARSSRIRPGLLPVVNPTQPADDPRAAAWSMV